jgi:peptidoglycan/xylan/chitin deacetylase (PgdA/CDA1 family)
MSAKTLLRNGAARLLYLSGLTSPKRRARGRLSIVTFHRVLPARERDAYPYPGLVVTPEELDWLLGYFKAHFDCGPLASQHERHVRGERCARPLLALTFDDAQHDNYANARPILARRSLKASFFVPVVAVERQEPLWHDRLGFALLDLLGEDRKGLTRLAGPLATAGISIKAPGPNLVSDIAQAAKGLPPETRSRLVDGMFKQAAKPVPAFARMMNFDEIAILAKEGHEVGSHSMTHRMMPECDDESLSYELVESQRVLELRTGTPIETFCYPNGDADERTSAAVAAAGYRRAVTTTWGDNGPDANPFALRRFDMDVSRMLDGRGKLVGATLAYRMSGFHSMSQ